MRNLFAKFALLTILISSAVLLTAQDSSSMAGVVTDKTGALIPGTVVALTNPSTGATFTKTTDNLGAYRFPSVPAGSGYKVTFTHDGFSIAQVSDITLNVGITRTQNIELNVGGESQTVSVSAGNQTVTLNTTDATIGNNIDVNQLNDLPVYDRTTGISSLMYQQPGVDSSQGAVTGARSDQSEVTVDGLDADDQATGQTFYLTTPAPVDSVEQFTGSVAGLDSNTGTGSGGQFQLVTRYGTNKFHGNVNEYHRDTTTVANTWFNNLDGIPRTPLIRNQFGGNIGGPIKRDKLFFFFNWGQSRIVQSATGEPIVPLPSTYGGLLAGKINYINSTSASCGDSSRVNNTQASCISTLTPTQIQNLDPAGIGVDPGVMAFIAARYPAANDLSVGDGVNTGGYRFTYPVPDNNINYIGRVDYNLTSTQKIFGKFNIEREDAVSALPEFPTDPSTHPFQDRSYSYVVSHEWTIGKNKVNTVYYGNQVNKLSFPDLYNPTGANQYGMTGLSGPYTSYDGQKRRIPVPVVRDDFEWQKGNHNITFGATFKWIKTNSNLISDFNYPGIGETGSALSFGLDDGVRPTIANGYTTTTQINEGPNTPNNVPVNDYDSIFPTALGIMGEIGTNYTYNNKGAALPAGTGQQRAYRWYQTEAYFGDNWKMTSKLTFTYGVRYQLYTVPYETHGDESISSPIPLGAFIQDRIAQQNSGNTSNTGLPFYSYLLGGKANNGPALYQPNYKDFAPRVSLAWTPWSSGKTVLRAGAGIVYDRTVINAVNFLQDQNSFLFANSNENQFGAATIDGSIATDPRVGANLAYSATLNPPAQAVTTPYTPYVDSTGTPYGLATGLSNFVFSPNLKDPYSIAINAGVEQDLPFHMILKVNYVGRLGRRLIADADANQLIDVPDYTGGSTQSLAGAFAGLTRDERNNAATLTPEPWFEDVMPAYGTLVGFNNNTELVAAMIEQNGVRGDITDSLSTLAYYSYYRGYTGFLPTNIGIPTQFTTNAYLTNMGSSDYHGLLVTLDKNISDGLRFEFNYTWAHSIDNTSLIANSNPLFNGATFATEMICDILRPRACRASSDFDERQAINSNFIYELPFGRGKQFGSSMAHGWDEVVGGWEISGLPFYRTGLPYSAFSQAFLASDYNNDPAIFTGTSKADLKTTVNVDHTTGTVYSFKGGSAGAQKVLNEFRGPLGIEYGQRNLIRGPGAFFLDAGLGKKFPILEDKLDLKFRADAFNVLNHPNFGGGSVNIVNSASNFGQITGTVANVGGIDNRVAQFSLRLEF